MRAMFEGLVIPKTFTIALQPAAYLKSFQIENVYIRTCSLGHPECMYCQRTTLQGSNRNKCKKKNGLEINLRPTNLNIKAIH